MEDYNWYMEQAAKYREMAKNPDGYQRQAVFGAAIDCERKARLLKVQSEQTDTTCE